MAENKQSTTPQQTWRIPTPVKKMVLGIVGFIVVYSLYLMWQVLPALWNEPHLLEDESASVICEIGFFYDTRHPISWRKVVRLEELAKQVCDPDDYADRRTLEWRAPNGDPLYAEYQVENSICLVAWELHPVEHEKAVREACKPHDWQSMMEDGIDRDRGR